jgi:transcription initiation factor TFIIIB Brf1 subunit/transcription initiation factor TFIIB
MNMKSGIKPRCSKCDSTQTYVRISTAKIVCRNCGHEEPIKGAKVKETNNIRCGICGSSQVRKRIRSGEIVCQRCGSITNDNHS